MHDSRSIILDLQWLLSFKLCLELLIALIKDYKKALEPNNISFIKLSLLESNIYAIIWEKCNI